MLTDFAAEYATRCDDELLHLATQRHIFTEEAAANGAWRRTAGNPTRCKKLASYPGGGMPPPLHGL